MKASDWTNYCIKENDREQERKTMNNQFDELTKGMAQSVTRRAALKKFGVGIAGMALACLGLANKVEAAPRSGYCQFEVGTQRYTGTCVNPTTCQQGTSSQCQRQKGGRAVLIGDNCSNGFFSLDTHQKCSF